MEDELGPGERSVEDLLRAEGERMREELASDPEGGERFWLRLLQRWCEHRARPMYACPRCYAPTTHPRDIEEGYCVRCHDWTGVREFTTEDFENLLACSSLGSPQARSLQAQCPADVRERFEEELDVQRDARTILDLLLAAPEPAGLSECEVLAWYMQQLPVCGTVVLRASSSRFRGRRTYLARVFKVVFDYLCEG